MARLNTASQQRPLEELATPQALEPIFRSIKIGRMELSSRVVYAPLARCRALNTIPSSMAIQYYAERANRGQLMVTEATVVNEYGHGVPNSPGIYTQTQEDAWKPIVSAVHSKGAFFFCQLWYCGRVSHSSYNPGNVLPMSASSVPISDGTTSICPNTFQPLEFEVPKPMEAEDIAALVASFRKAARAAIECGFDGIEVHGASGYIIDQFLKSSSNKRTDEYGGSVENRSRLCLEVLDAIVEEIGADRVGIRFSPYGNFNDVTDEDPHSLYTYLCDQIRQRGVAYVHMIESRVNGATDLDVSSPQVVKETLTHFRRAAAPLPFIAAGGYTRDNSAPAVQSGQTDLVSVGRWALANPDLLSRWKLGAPLNSYDRSTFYTPFPEGYIDYPFLLDTPEGAPYHAELAVTPIHPSTPSVCDGSPRMRTRCHSRSPFMQPTPSTSTACSIPNIHYASTSAPSSVCSASDASSESSCAPESEYAAPAPRGVHVAQGSLWRGLKALMLRTNPFRVAKGTSADSTA